jgi:hypothetical protein
MSQHEHLRDQNDQVFERATVRLSVFAHLAPLVAQRHHNTWNTELRSNHKSTAQSRARRGTTLRHSVWHSDRRKKPRAAALRYEGAAAASSRALFAREATVRLVFAPFSTQ